MEIGTTVKLKVPIVAGGVLLVMENREGVLVPRPDWYDGLRWPYYIEFKAGIVVGVRLREIQDARPGNRCLEGLLQYRRQRYGYNREAV